jgi:hypothetical protein
MNTESEPQTSHPPLTQEEALQDCHDSYYAAVAELRRRLLAGEPLDQRHTKPNDCSIYCDED